MNKVPVAIHSVPRSGSTWLGEILNSSDQTAYRYQPLFSYALKDYLDSTSSRERCQRFFELLETTEDSFLNQEDVRRVGKLPRFPKGRTTHVVYKEVRYHHVLGNLVHRLPEMKVICLVRDPRAVMCSWLKAPREFRLDLGWKTEEEWRGAPSKNQKRPEEFYGFEKWKESCRIFLGLEKARRDSVKVVRYVDLLENPEEVTRDIFEFCGLPVGAQTEMFLKESQSKTNSDVYSVYRKRQRDDAWKADLPETIAREIEEEVLRDKVLRGFMVC